MSRVIHFEIPAVQGEKAVAFYKEVFGWECSRYGNQDYWLADTGDEREPGINGAIIKPDDIHQTVINTLGVADLVMAEKRILEFGGVILKPRMAIPSVGWLLYFKDPFGNIFGVMQADPNAK